MSSRGSAARAVQTRKRPSSVPPPPRSHKQQRVVGHFRLTDDVAPLVQSELQQIAGEGDIGGLKPHDVVQYAIENPQSALFRFFEWDQAKAAWKYWESQARALIAAVRIRITTRSGEVGRVRAWHSVKIGVRGDETRTRSVYLPREHVLRETNLRKQVVERALNELRQWMNRHAEIDELQTARETIKGLLP